MSTKQQVSIQLLQELNIKCSTIADNSDLKVILLETLKILQNTEPGKRYRFDGTFCDNSVEKNQYLKTLERELKEIDHTSNSLDKLIFNYQSLNALIQSMFTDN